MARLSRYGSDTWLPRLPRLGAVREVALPRRWREDVDATLRDLDRIDFRVRAP